MFPWLTETPADHLNAVQAAASTKWARGDVLALILDGTLEPGAPIAEAEVASRLQVPLGSVQQALHELQDSGLLVPRKPAGFAVRQLKAGEVRDLYQMRGLLDGFAGRCAALLGLGPRAALLTELAAAIDAMFAAASRNDLQAYFGENLRFHWAIVQATGNQLLCDTYREVVQKAALIRLKNLSQDLGMLASIAEHVEIAQAVRDTDAVRCEALLVRHADDAYARFVRARPARPRGSRSQPPARAKTQKLVKTSA